MVGFLCSPQVKLLAGDLKSDSQEMTMVRATVQFVGVDFQGSSKDAGWGE